MIGIFNDNFPPILDGVALTAKNYADWLSKSGKEVCVVTPYAPEMPGATAYPVYRYLSVGIPMRRPYRYGLPWMDPLFLRRFGQLRFELVHAHCPFTSGTLALKAARKQRIPIVATFHSKYRQDFERAVPWENVIDWEIKNIIRFYEQVDEVWIPQAAVEPTLREYGYKGPVEVVENGNDFVSPAPEIERIRRKMRQELGLNTDQTMLLFVGQHIWEKGIGFTLDALAQIKQLPYRLYTIGTGYAVEGIKQKIRELGVEKKVVMLGVISNRDVLKRYYAAADMFLFPSMYDNAPLVVREAAAMHTPTIMMRNSTASEVIRDNYNGFLVGNDTAEYAQSIRHLMENPHLVHEVGNNASSTIARSWESVVEEVTKRYEDIIRRYKQN